MWWREITCVFMCLCLSLSLVKATTYGPYNLLFGDENEDMRVSWVVKSPTNPADKAQGRLSVTMSLAAEFSWMIFGFALGELSELPPPGDEDPLPMDVVAAWIDSKDKVHLKDCVSTTPSLVIDKHQDYHHVQHHRTSSGGLNITFYRSIDTGDHADLKIKRGTISLVYGYGTAHRFQQIKKDFMLHRKTTEAIVIPDEYFNSAIEGNSKNEDGKDSLEPSSEKNSAILPTATETKSSELITSSPNRIGQELVRTRLVYIKANCTDTDEKAWYEVLKVRESSIYYAIIGTAALMTGIIVLLIACCCARKASTLSRDPMKAKVAFYKVDDYEDEEHVEFLKERS